MSGKHDGLRKRKGGDKNGIAGVKKRTIITNVVQCHHHHHQKQQQPYYHNVHLVLHLHLI